jgi:hypothetical protein
MEHELAQMEEGSNLQCALDAASPGGDPADDVSSRIASDLSAMLMRRTELNFTKVRELRELVL